MVKMLEPMDIYTGSGYHVAAKQRRRTQREGKNKHGSSHRNKIAPEISHLIY
jgi:hypothetical protein